MKKIPNYMKPNAAWMQKDGNQDPEEARRKAEAAVKARYDYFN